MKKVFILTSLLIILVTAACKKSSTNPDPAAGANFKFSEIVAADTVIKVNDITTLTAVATGDGLSYKWTANYGTFVGSGSTVQWTVCHQAKFTINCEVTDQYSHAETKTIIVRAHN
jgi:hypothetical protein